MTNGLVGPPLAPLAGPGVEEAPVIGDVDAQDGFAAGPIIGHWKHDFTLRRLKLETGATIPARAPASMLMLQIVIRPSIDSASMVLPRYSRT